MSKCLCCGKEVIQNSHHKNGKRKFCNIDCYKKYRGCKTFGYSYCEYCGKQFKETRDRPNKFCSKECSNRYYGKIRTEKKLQRIQAEKEQIQREREQKEFLRQQKEQERLEKLRKVCPMCGKEFIAKSITNICCSKECSRRRNNYTRYKRIYRNGKPDLTISLTRLYMRDNGICQICNRLINFDCDSNSDYYPSIDHIIPLSKGGLHSWDNVQLACRICNTWKRDKIIG